jgi:methyl-accepting chemotaxis protein
MGQEKPRKIVFIDKRFQGEFILKFVALLLVGTGVFVAAAYLILNRRLEETYYSAHYAIKSTGEVLLPTLLALSGVFIVVLGAAAVVITMYVSHHIAGPLFAIRRYLENISRGELDFEAKLRPGDQTTALAESLAGALETLNAKLVAIRTRADAVSEASEKLSRHVSAASGASAECRADLGELLEREAALSREMAFFHLRPPSGAR